MLKFENGKFNIFYTNKYNFKRLLSRPKLQEFILKFNKSNKSINASNFSIVMKNMQNFITDFEIKINNKNIKYKLVNINENIIGL